MIKLIFHTKNFIFIVLAFIFGLICPSNPSYIHNLHKCTVKFMSFDGTTEYTDLQKIVDSGSTITLPEEESLTGYEAAGWSASPNCESGNYTAGQSLLITHNITLYAAYKIKTYTLTLCRQNGEIYQTLTYNEGSSVTLPSVYYASPYSQNGWDSNPGKDKNPQYVNGEKITLNSDLKLYMVVFDKNNEVEIPADSITKVYETSFDAVIMVGDSRTVRIQSALENTYPSDVYENVFFICKGGSGLRWLKSQDNGGYVQLQNKINELNKQGQKKIAVIFNHGGNDYSNILYYITFMKSIASDLISRGCTLFYESADPLNYATICQMIGPESGNKRTDADTIEFNKQIKFSLCTGAGYHYINAFDYLEKTGIGFDRNRSGNDDDIVDGLHYCRLTSAKLYAFRMDFLKQYSHAYSME